MDKVTDDLEEVDAEEESMKWMDPDKRCQKEIDHIEHEVAPLEAEVERIREQRKSILSNKQGTS